MPVLVVAIDGPAGAGKSTLASRLAQTLDLPYLNTGLMYRALTLEAVRLGLDLDDGEGLARHARTMRFELSSTGRPRSLLIGGTEPVEALSSPEVELNVSRVSAHQAVRDLLRAEQRRLGEPGAVVEGRDIGSVVFPDAAVKLFLLAPHDVRAARRALERETHAAPEEIGRALRARDELDARVNPFEPPPGATVIDTAGKDPDRVFEEAIATVREAS